MAESECLPEKSQCQDRGLSWYDWAYSFFKRLCTLIAWAAAIFGAVRKAPYGKLPLAPAHAFVNASGDIKTITVPAGAISIQAIIDNEYAAAYRLTVRLSGVDHQLPAGSDFNLPAITPMYCADVDGNGGSLGYGYYPAYVFKYPAGSRGMVTAIYREVAPDITVA